MKTITTQNCSFQKFHTNATVHILPLNSEDTASTPLSLGMNQALPALCGELQEKCLSRAGARRVVFFPEEFECLLCPDKMN